MKRLDGLPPAPGGGRPTVDPSGERGTVKSYRTTTAGHDHLKAALAEFKRLQATGCKKSKK